MDWAEDELPVDKKKNPFDRGCRATSLDALGDGEKGLGGGDLTPFAFESRASFGGGERARSISGDAS